MPTPTEVSDGVQLRPHRLHACERVRLHASKPLPSMNFGSIGNNRFGHNSQTGNPVIMVPTTVCETVGNAYDDDGTRVLVRRNGPQGLIGVSYCVRILGSIRLRDRVPLAAATGRAGARSGLRCRRIGDPRRGPTALAHDPLRESLLA